MVLNNFIKAACLSTCLGLASGSILADEANYNVDTNGGLRVYDSSDNNHWFHLSGKMQLDGSLTHANGDVNGALNLNAVQTDVKGGIGKDTSYSFRLSAGDEHAALSKAKLTYSGFNSWSKVSVGQVSMPYGLDSGSSFLADNPVQSFFSPKGKTLGASVDAWNDKMGFSFAVSQANAGKISSVNDFNTSGRLSFAAVNRDNLTVHLGLSGYFQTAPSHGDFKRSLGSESISMSNATVAGKTNCFSFDAAVLRGPVFIQGEYHSANFDGNKDKALANKAQGWSVETSYALTGEERSYDYRNGSFGSLRTNRDTGSWEVSLRHSEVKVAKDQWRSVGASVGWTVNNNVKLLADYLYTPGMSTSAKVAKDAKTDLNNGVGALSVRLQAAW